MLVLVLLRRAEAPSAALAREGRKVAAPEEP